MGLGGGTGLQICLSMHRRQKQDDRNEKYRKVCEVDGFNDVGILLQEHLCDYCHPPHRYFLFYYIRFTAYNFAPTSAEISEEEKY